ncbi:MAG: isoprenylcysteine carboxylmethyltransferase family protein [Bacteroidales bacterium]|nr:isoprenylcysteine carboxylmethyltransferase family protein [Bacteroidales bacterium]
MERIIIFGILSTPVIFLSRRTLFKPKSHGFYRFFSWECILWLVASNYLCWFKNPFSIPQIFSWMFLAISLYLLIAGVKRIKKTGKQEKNRDEKTLYAFEKTAKLIDTGIFKYIRHPMYSSLLFLTWGIFLKNTTGELFVIASVSTIFLFLTAISDEKESIRFFGDPYREYIKRSKRFIPFIL